MDQFNFFKERRHSKFKLLNLKFGKLVVMCFVERISGVHKSEKGIKCRNTYIDFSFVSCLKTSFFKCNRSFFYRHKILY
jgi:hypothetical protein